MPSVFYPGVLGFLLGIAGETAYHLPWAVAALVSLTGVCLLLVRRFAIATLLLAACIGMARTSVAPRELPHDLMRYLDRSVEIGGVVVVPPDVRETSTRITVDVGATNVLAVISSHPDVHVGDHVQVSGMFVLPEPFEAGGGRTFRYDQFLSKDGITALVQPASVVVLGISSDPVLRTWRVLASGREALVRALTRALPQPESALAAGIIAGGKQGLGKELLDAFTVAGMLQIVVLSGFNVMIVANGILRMLAFLPQRTSFAIAVLGLSSFVLAAGAGSAALRAGLMALLAVFARTFGRTHDVLRALSVSLVGLLLWNPLLLVHDPGLQLSFIATLGLVLGTPFVERVLAWIPGAAVRELVGTTLAAQIAVLPLLLYQSGNLSFVSLFANVLAAPAIPWAMAGSGVAALFALIPFMPHVVLHVVALPAYILLAYILKVATVSAAAPFAQVILPAFPLWLMFISYAVLGWFVYTKTPASAGVVLEAR